MPTLWLSLSVPSVFFYSLGNSKTLETQKRENEIQTKKLWKKKKRLLKMSNDLLSSLSFFVGGDREKALESTKELIL